MTSKVLASILVLALALLSFVSACSKALDCAHVSSDQCGNTRGCLPLGAQRIRYPDDPTMRCTRAEETEALLCAPAMECDKNEPAVAKDPNGVEWLVTSPCLPAGWTKTTATPSIAACVLCGTLTVAACGGVDYCVTIDGQPVDLARTCVLAGQTIGCITKTTYGCGPHTTVATDPAGADWFFATSCVPAGFEMLAVRDPAFPACPAGDGGADDAGGGACETVAASACAARPDCHVRTGSLIDTEHGCSGPPEPAACESLPDGGGVEGCGVAITLATDTWGRRWLFPSTCVPAGWTHVNQVNGTVPACPASDAAADN